MRSASHARSSSLSSVKAGTVFSCCARLAVAVAERVPISNLRQMSVHKLDGDRALAYAGCYAFDGAVPNVANGEHAGNAGFEQERIAVDRPTGRTFGLFQEVRACEDEASAVPFDEAIEPVRTRRSADEYEHTVGPHTVDRAG